MMRGYLLKFSSFATTLMLVFSPVVKAAESDTSTKEFITSCTYGVMAGTLVGVASLAFTSKPSDSLNRVARGASLGLYIGILLGVYVVYVIPGMEVEPEEDPVLTMDKMPVLVSPTLSQNNEPDGVRADWKILRF